MNPKISSSGAAEQYNSMDGGAAGNSTGNHPLLRRQTAKRSYSTMAESHRSTSPDTLFVTPDGHHDNELAARRPRLSNRLALPSMPPRFVGDGLDFRRPMTSDNNNGSSRQSERQNARPVIDLTEEDDDVQDEGRPAVMLRGEPAEGSSRARRGPRFGRDIIDLVDDPDPEQLTRHRLHASAPSPPRPNYLSLFPPRADRTTNPHPRYSSLGRPQRGPTTSRTNGADHWNGVDSRSVTPFAAVEIEPIDLTGDDDDVVFLESRPGVNAESPTATGGAGTRSVADRLNDLTNFEAAGGRLLHHLNHIQRALAGLGSQHDHQEHGHHAGARVLPPPFVPAQLRADYAIGLDFDLPAFDLGLQGGNQTTADKYEAPEDAHSGFTRSPAEDEVVVCPNCGDELAISEDDTKQEVWIIKKCGHAYCGNCARYRAKTSRGKGKAPAHSMPLAFKECVIYGCREKAGAKAMVHIYLGS